MSHEIFAQIELGQGFETTHSLASSKLETFRIPDPYYYLIGPDGELYSPATGRPVEEAIEQRTALGRAEARGFKKIKEGIKVLKKGRKIAWISPPTYRNNETSPKMTVSEIIGEEDFKLLFNIAHVVDNLGNSDCLEYAEGLSAGLRFSSIEELRTSPIIVDENVDWVNSLGNYVDVSRLRRLLESGEYIEEKKKALMEAKILQQKGKAKMSTSLSESEIRRNFPGFLGSYGLVCQPRLTAFEQLFGNALFGFFECPNPRCKGKIPSGRGITTCPHCGARKEDYGSACD